MAVDTVHQGFFTPQMVVRGLTENARLPVLRMKESVLKGAEVADEISRYAQLLHAHGVRKGSRVGILSGNRLEVLHVTFAINFVEAARVALHPMGSVDDYAYVVNDASIDTLIFDAERYGAKVDALRAKAPGLTQLLSLGPCAFARDLCAEAARISARPLVAPPVTADDLMVIGYSGGTTGKPKGTPLTYGGAHAMTIIQMSEWEWPQNIRQLLCAPLSHAGGAMFVPMLLRGGEAFVLPNFDALEVLKAIETHRINCVLLVPTMIYALLDHPRFGDFNLSSLQTVFYGASSISPARLREAIEKIGPVFFQFYGQAEAPMSVTVMRRHEHQVSNPQRLASCGRPVPWLDVKLLDSAGNEVAAGQPGEICVRGPLVMRGYLNQPALTEEAFRHGWLHTGDIAVQDPDGFLRIVDRSKDMIITGGFNVYPREVEDALATHPAVAAASVFGVADAHWGEIVTAAVVLREGRQVTATELIAHARELKGSVQAPKIIRFIDAVPLTAVGKPDKKALRARFSNPAP